MVPPVGSVVCVRYEENKMGWDGMGSDGMGWYMPSPLSFQLHTHSAPLPCIDV